MIPIFILLTIAFPSLHLLYVRDLVVNPDLTFKSIGYQWYWRYEYNDFGRHMMFYSYMKGIESLREGDYRMLDVDNRLVLPYGKELKNVISSGDVIHSWAVPIFGVKVDGVPGRANQIAFTVFRPGVFYGQCSEICGANHAYMPICAELIR